MAKTLPQNVFHKRFFLGEEGQVFRLFHQLEKKLDYLSDDQRNRVREAFLLAKEAHKEQRRSSGEPYITHPISVAINLADMKMDEQSCMAGLLHDVIEDCDITKAHLVEQFDETVADLVDGVTKLGHIDFQSKAEAQAENFRKMTLAMAQDIRVIIIKLADRLHNMNTMGSLKPVKRRRIARETLEIYAPIAKRLGMREVAVELEDLGFHARYPKRYEAIESALRKARGTRLGAFNEIDQVLRQSFDDSGIEVVKIVGREKHLYSIYRKMRDKHIPFAEVKDVYAYRITLNNMDDCYRALGVVHQAYKPVPERFKDYIAIPKANGYQSLHTTLFGPRGIPLEVQIRTKEMSDAANRGVAAHWIYKANNKYINQSQVRAQNWLKDVLKLQRETGNSLEFIENVKVDLFPDEVYVFTPRGGILELSSGATALDFAYAVHTEIGNHAVAAKIDKKLVALSTRLKSGQAVEVVTEESARPKESWLEFVFSAKARSSIKQALKVREENDAIKVGEGLLKKSLDNHHVVLKKIPVDIVDAVVAQTNCDSFQHLCEQIGLGNRVALLVAHRFINEMKVDDESVEGVDKTAKAPVPFMIKGTEGVAVSFAACCHPIPGDPIVALIQSGKGFKVHRDDCERVVKFKLIPEKCVAVEWESHIDRDFEVPIRAVLHHNKRGLFAQITNVIAQQDASIETIHVGKNHRLDLRLTVYDRQHLERVFAELKSIPALDSVWRV